MPITGSKQWPRCPICMVAEPWSLFNPAVREAHLPHCANSPHLLK